VDEGIRLGVIVTPAFFIHGRLIVGSCFEKSFSFYSNFLKLLIKSSSLSRALCAENAQRSSCIWVQRPHVALV
jgi:hypothetical protein